MLLRRHQDSLREVIVACMRNIISPDRDDVTKMLHKTLPKMRWNAAPCFGGFAQSTRRITLEHSHAPLQPSPWKILPSENLCVKYPYKSKKKRSRTRAMSLTSCTWDLARNDFIRTPQSLHHSTEGKAPSAARGLLDRYSILCGMIV